MKPPFRVSDVQIVNRLPHEEIRSYWKRIDKWRKDIKAIITKIAGDYPKSRFGPMFNLVYMERKGTRYNYFVLSDNHLNNDLFGPRSGFYRATVDSNFPNRGEQLLRIGEQGNYYPFRDLVSIALTQVLRAADYFTTSQRTLESAIQAIERSIEELDEYDSEDTNASNGEIIVRKSRVKAALDEMRSALGYLAAFKEIKHTESKILFIANRPHPIIKESEFTRVITNRSVDVQIYHMPLADITARILSYPVYIIRIAPQDVSDPILFVLYLRDRNYDQMRTALESLPKRRRMKLESEFYEYLLGIYEQLRAGEMMLSIEMAGPPFGTYVQQRVRRKAAPAMDF